MSARFQDTVDEVAYPVPELLQDILALKEPYRTYCLQRWMDTYDYEHGGTVKLMMSDGRGKKLLMEDGHTINITPSGKTVAREVALDILMAYGKGGLYHGIDRPTGVTEVAYRAMHKDTQAFFDGHKFDYNQAYVYQVPFNRASDDSEVDDTPTGDDE